MNIPNAPSTAHDNYDATARQVATSAASTRARLDPETETKLYRLYREYFQQAENHRTWNLWETIDWSGVTAAPSENLTNAVRAAWREDTFLPDTSATLLQTLRASRGRAWFVTRWSYEEGKHLLSWAEWLVRAGVATQYDLKDESEAILLAQRWAPPHHEANALMVDALLWEMREVERTRHIRRLAQTEGDAALEQLCDLMLADEEAQRDFFRSALQIISGRYPEATQTAAQQVAQSLEYPGGARAVLALWQD